MPIAIFVSVGLLNWESISYYTLKKAAQFYAGRVDIALDIGSISGKPFSETIFENVSLRPGKGEPQAYHFKAQSISCNYDILDLKKGLEFFVQGVACSAQEPEIIQDFTVSMPEEEVASEFKMFQIPAVLPRLEVQNGTVSLSHSSWDLAIRGINANMRSADGAHALQLEGDNFQFNQDGASRIDTGFTSLLRYSDAKLTIDSLEMGEQEVSATGFIELAQVDKGINGFAADLAFVESRLNISGSMENRLLKTNVKTDGFDIGELQKRLGGSGWDVSGNIRAEADLAVNLEKPEELKGSFVLGVDKGRVHGVDIETVSLEGVFDQENLNRIIWKIPGQVAGGARGVVTDRNS